MFSNIARLEEMQVAAALIGMHGVVAERSPGAAAIAGLLQQFAARGIERLLAFLDPAAGETDAMASRAVLVHPDQHHQPIAAGRRDDRRLAHVDLIIFRNDPPVLRAHGLLREAKTVGLKQHLLGERFPGLGDIGGAVAGHAGLQAT